jgi:hypothetical protein
VGKILKKETTLTDVSINSSEILKFILEELEGTKMTHLDSTAVNTAVNAQVS